MRVAKNAVQERSRVKSKAFHPVTRTVLRKMTDKKTASRIRKAALLLCERYRDAVTYPFEIPLLHTRSAFLTQA